MELPAIAALDQMMSRAERVPVPSLVGGQRSGSCAKRTSAVKCGKDSVPYELRLVRYFSERLLESVIDLERHYLRLALPHAVIPGIVLFTISPAQLLLCNTPMSSIFRRAEEVYLQARGGSIVSKSAVIVRLGRFRVSAYDALLPGSSHVWACGYKDNEAHSLRRARECRGRGEARSVHKLID